MVRGADGVTRRPRDAAAARPYGRAVDGPELLLIRHAESVWNAERRWQGQEDPPLSAQGRVQAGALARALTGVAIARIVTSDLERARATAEALGHVHGLRATTDPRLRELDVGRWGGRTREEIARCDPELLARFDRGDRQLRAGGGESRHALRERARAALRDLIAESPTGCIAVVTHLGWLREIVPGADFDYAEWRALSWQALLGDETASPR